MSRMVHVTLLTAFIGRSSSARRMRGFVVKDHKPSWPTLGASVAKCKNEVGGLASSPKCAFRSKRENAGTDRAL